MACTVHSAWGGRLTALVCVHCKVGQASTLSQWGALAYKALHVLLFGLLLLLLLQRLPFFATRIHGWLGG